MIKRYILAIVFILLSTQVWAEEELFPGLKLADAPINRHDMESVKRGAKIFATTCMSCHTMTYMRYDKVAIEAGVTYDKMPINITTWPYGVRPPDLSLEAGQRGVDWIYTYLHSFYLDPNRPTGYNNLLVHNTAMPAILSPLQGDQQLVKVPPPSSIMHGYTQWYDWLVLTKQGTQTPAEFDQTVTDITNFLAYATEPYHNEQQRIGWWVLGFLFILFFFMYALKSEYWKDIKKHKDK